MREAHLADISAAISEAYPAMDPYSIQADTAYHFGGRHLNEQTISHDALDNFYDKYFSKEYDNNYEEEYDA